MKKLRTMKMFEIAQDENSLRKKLRYFVQRTLFNRMTETSLKGGLNGEPQQRNWEEIENNKFLYENSFQSS